jgi:Tol biopolymer transport system component
MRFGLVAVSLAAALALMTFAPTIASAQTGTEPRTELVSQSVGASSSYFEPTDMSADGRFVVFASRARHGEYDLPAAYYIRDRKLQTTQRIRVATADETVVIQAVMSADGRWIAATGWDPGTLQRSVFLYEPTSRRARRVASARTAALSADGRWMLFATSEALVPGDVDSDVDLYVYDRTTSGYARVPVIPESDQNAEWTTARGISADGRFILFDSSSAIVDQDTNRVEDVFHHDRRSGVTRRVSVGLAGADGNGYSWESSMSDDGRHVAFTSLATNLVAGDTNSQPDVFVHDVPTGVTTRVSVGAFGAQGNGWAGSPVLSGNGNVVAFASTSDLAFPLSFGRAFVHDRTTGITRQADLGSNGRRNQGGGSNTSISADGRYVAFVTGASLVPGDPEGEDAYVHDFGTRAPHARLTSLIDDVMALGAPLEIRAPLVRLAERAADAIARGDRSGACRNVGAFIYDVQAQWHRDIAATDATHLFEDATQTQRDLGCPLSKKRVFDFYRSRFRAPEPSWYGLVTGDFNGDGHIDAAMAHAESISVFAGDGHASFGGSTRIPGFGLPRGLASADVNGDGVTDLVAANENGASASVLIATRGRLEFTRTDLPTGRYPLSVAAGDFTGDGRVDLAVANSGDSFLSLYRGTGRGRFARMEDLYIGYAASNVAIADVDGDGCADILMAGRGAVSLALGDKGGQPAFWNHLAFGVFRELEVADFNLDTRPDVASISGDHTTELRLLLNAGGGAFDDAGVVDIPSPFFLASGDLNGDGRPDIVASSYMLPLWVLQGNGDGTFGFLERFDGDIDVSTTKVADLNHDGALDVLVLASTARSLEYKRSPSLNVLVNRPRLSVTTANDPANWAIGSSQVIAWRHALPRGTSFRVELSRDNGVTWNVIAAAFGDTGSSGNFTWRVTGPATSQARFRVTALGDAAAVDLNDEPIAVSNPLIQLDGLNDRQWAIGSTQTIRYAHNLGARVPLALELSRDGGRTWSVIAENVRTNGSQSGTWDWTVTGPAAGKASIRVRAASGLTAGTLSGIAIGAPFIRLLPIRPATPWNACESREVRWTSNLGPNEPVELEVSTDEGTTWRTAGQSKRSKTRYAPPEHVPNVTVRARWVEHAVVAPSVGPLAVLTTPVPNWCEDGQ